MPQVRSVSTALRAFHDAHAALLIAAEALRVELERAAGTEPAAQARGDWQRSVRARLARSGVLPPAPKEVRAIQSVCAEHFHVSLAELCSQRRDHDTAWARFVAFALCRELTNCPAKAVGAAFARTDHSLVAYGCTNVAQRCDVEPAFAAEMTIVREKARSAIVALSQPKEARSA